jgi:hypothetical protein
MPLRSTLAAMSLVVTGTVGIDTIVTPKAHAEGVLGGSCAYFAAAASFFGAVRMVAAVGEDFPDAHRKTLLSFKGIDSAGLETRRGGKTFSWGGKYLPGMNSRESMFTELGVVGEKPPEVPGAYRDSRFVFLANMPPAVQGAMLDQFPSRVLSVADTMDLWIASANADLRALLRRVDGLVLNYDEAEQLTEKANVVSAARHILDMGPALRRGEEGRARVHPRTSRRDRGVARVPLGDGDRPHRRGRYVRGRHDGLDRGDRIGRGRRQGPGVVRFGATGARLRHGDRELHDREL